MCAIVFKIVFRQVCYYTLERARIYKRILFWCCIRSTQKRKTSKSITLRWSKNISCRMIILMAYLKIKYCMIINLSSHSSFIWHKIRNKIFVLIFHATYIGLKIFLNVCKNTKLHLMLFIQWIKWFFKFFRNTKLHRSRNFTWWRLLFFCGLVGTRGTFVWNVGRKKSLWYGWSNW